MAFEIQQLLENNRVRAVAMGAKDCQTRGMEIAWQRSIISVLVKEWAATLQLHWQPSLYTTGVSSLLLCVKKKVQCLNNIYKNRKFKIFACASNGSNLF